MGFLSKLTKKSIGGKLLKKAISKDPVGSKVLGKSKGAQHLGIVDRPGRAKPAVKTMTTGGNQKPSVAGKKFAPATPARRMDALSRPAARRRFQ